MASDNKATSVTPELKTMPDGRTMIYHALQYPKITGEINRDDPGEPTVRIESGCNELWLGYEEAVAVRAYLDSVIPKLAKGGDPL